MRKVPSFIHINNIGARSMGRREMTFTASMPDVVVSGGSVPADLYGQHYKVRIFVHQYQGVRCLNDFAVHSIVQIINGNVTSTSSITFTYILMADKEGTYTIPGATIVADGQKQNFKFRTNQSITA